MELGAAVEAVLLGTLADEVVLLEGELVVFLGLQVVFPGDEFVLIEGLLLLVGALEAVHLGAVLQHVLADVQLLLLHLDLGVAEDVLLLRQLGLGVQDLQVQVVVIEDENGVVVIGCTRPLMRI